MIMRYTLFIVMLLAAFTSLAQPTFKGGEQELDNYLKEHIVYPEFARKNCITATIQVSFRVNKNGTVDQVQVDDGPGIDLDDEAIRVIKTTAGKWTLPNGSESTKFSLSIRFAPDYSRCIAVTKMSMNQAITAYKARQSLEDAITNYYQNKYAGKADISKQNYIDDLKQQLGFDDDFITDVLQQAQDKMKQGDHEGACTDWKFILNIGSDKANAFLAKYCK